VTETYDFTLGNFVYTAGSITSPITSFSGSFTLTFDPSLTINDQTTDITGSLSGVPGAPGVDTPISFSNYPGNPLGFSIGGTSCSSSCVFSFTNDFVLQLTFLSGNPADPVFTTCAATGQSCGSYNNSPTVIASGYSESDTAFAWFATTGSVTAVTATPLPSTWMLLISGFVGIGFFAYRGAKNNPAALAAA